MASKVHVKKGDTVVVLSGKDKGTKGKVLSVYPKTNRVIVEGVNMLTKHTKPRRQGDTGGILHQEGEISASNVMYVCSKCKKSVRTGTKVLDNGDKVRYCKKCDEVIND